MEVEEYLSRATNAHTRVHTHRVDWMFGSLGTLFLPHAQKAKGRGSSSHAMFFKLRGQEAERECAEVEEYLLRAEDSNRALAHHSKYGPGLDLPKVRYLPKQGENQVCVWVCFVYMGAPVSLSFACISFPSRALSLAPLWCYPVSSVCLSFRVRMIASAC